MRPKVAIDVEADLNMEDDEGRNLARVPRGYSFAPGDVAMAGRQQGWSWVLLDDVEGDSLYFHQISASEAAQHGPPAGTD